jgi:hypothetical protein
MKALVAAALLVSAWGSRPAFAQADRCRGAMTALNRVKEQIVPDLSPQSPGGRERLRTMLFTLETATNVCKDVADLWYYRSIVAERLGTKDSYSESRYRELGYQPPYNPFSVPQAAEAPPAEESAASGVHRKWALVVGIDKFQDPHLPPLNYAVKDSTDFVDFLLNPAGGRFQKDRVRHLVNDEATLRGIREGLGWLRANVERDDLVVIYFSSHGSPREQDPNGVSYIMTSDTSTNGVSLYATSLQMIDLVQGLNRDLKARRVVLILDTCYSGDASGGHDIRPVWSITRQRTDSQASDVFSGALSTLKIGYGRAVLTATRADQVSWERSKTDWTGGYFTHFLIKALGANQGQEPLGKVFPKVQDQVTSEVRHELGENQSPSCDFSDGAASIIIGVPEG